MPIIQNIRNHFLATFLLPCHEAKPFSVSGIADSYFWNHIRGTVLILQDHLLMQITKKLPIIFLSYILQGSS